MWSNKKLSTEEEKSISDLPQDMSTAPWRALSLSLSLCPTEFSPLSLSLILSVSDSLTHSLCVAEIM